MKHLLIALLLGAASAAHAAETAKAIFAGGCFWCTEADFEKLPGVKAAVSGYIGGSLRNPTYEQISSGRTGHAEAVEISYDPAVVSYAKLLEHFWLSIDPTTVDAQFCDSGSQYRSGIFYATEAEKKQALESTAVFEKRLGQPIVTEITAASTFYPAEDYHQDYYKKNPVRYRYYRRGCGRDARLEQLWGRSRGQ